MTSPVLAQLFTRQTRERCRWHCPLTLSLWIPLWTLLLNKARLGSKWNNFVKSLLVPPCFCWSQIGRRVFHRPYLFSYNILNVIYSLRISYICILDHDHIYSLTPHPSSSKHSPTSPSQFHIPFKFYSLCTTLWVQWLLLVCTCMVKPFAGVDYLQRATMTDRGQKNSFRKTLLIIKSDLLHLVQRKNNSCSQNVSS